MIFISVDLPAPFSPSTAWISPGITVRSTPSFATTDGYAFRMPVRRRRGTAGGAAVVILPPWPCALRARGLLVLAVRRSAFAMLEELRRDRDRDRARLLPLNPRDADRTSEACEEPGPRAALRQPVLERAALRLRADHSAIGEIAAAQDRLDEFEVERVAVRHHEEIAAGAGRADLRRRRVGPHDANVVGHLRRKLVGTVVHPSDAARDRPEDAHQRPAHMAGRSEER